MENIELKTYYTYIINNMMTIFGNIGVNMLLKIQVLSLSWIFWKAFVSDKDKKLHEQINKTNNIKKIFSGGILIFVAQLLNKF